MPICVARSQWPLSGSRGVGEEEGGNVVGGVGKTVMVDIVAATMRMCIDVESWRKSIGRSSGESSQGKRQMLLVHRREDRLAARTRCCFGPKD
jgi:hypothetical protein